MLIRQLFIRVVSGRLRTWAKRSTIDIDDLVIIALEQPIGLIPIVLGFFFVAEFLQPAAPSRCSPEMSSSR